MLEREHRAVVALDELERLHEPRAGHAIEQCKLAPQKLVRCGLAPQLGMQPFEGCLPPVRRDGAPDLGRAAAAAELYRPPAAAKRD